MFTEPTTFRPRNGLSVEAYWRIRAWCKKNGFNFSDVLNAVIIPIAYYLENHCKIDKLRSKATVTLDIGDLDILHVFQGKCYPLASDSADGKKDGPSLEDMQKRIAHWKARNKERPQHYDLMLTTDTHGKISRKPKN